MEEDFSDAVPSMGRPQAVCGLQRHLTCSTEKIESVLNSSFMYFQ